MSSHLPGSSSPNHAFGFGSSGLSEIYGSRLPRYYNIEYFKLTALDIIKEYLLKFGT